jgi:hypothetical protein
MTIAEMNAAMLSFLNRCYATIEVKNVDYHPEGVPMLEVFRAAAEANITPQQVLWGHLRKQLSAVRTHVIGRQLQSEPIDSRFTDVVNYAALLQFLEANYYTLLGRAYTYVCVNTSCEREKPGQIEDKWDNCVDVGAVPFCDRCVLAEWLFRELKRVHDATR